MSRLARSRVRDGPPQVPRLVNPDAQRHLPGVRELGDGGGLGERGTALDVPGRQAVVAEMTELGEPGVERDHPQRGGVSHRLL
jgi:hypothetical protein